MLLHDRFSPPPSGSHHASMHLRIGPFFLTFVLVCRLGIAGLAAAEPAGPTVALTGFRLIDGTGRGPVENAVLIREAAADVRQMATRHPDLIKLWLDDLLGTAPKLKPDIYRTAIEEAHGLGLRVACHIYSLEDAKAVLRAGVNVIAHGVRDKPVDAEFIEQVRARSAGYVAMLALDEASYVFAEQPGWTKARFFQNALQPALQAQLRNPAYLQRMQTNPKVPIFKQAVATNEQNLKTLYDAVWHRGSKANGPIESFSP
jgi:hypothetical protein